MSDELKDRERITAILCSPDASDESRAHALWPVIYETLRNLADRQMARERPSHTLQPTALVHEAYLRLVDAPRVDWEGRGHFFGIASRVMRQILVDYSRRHKAEKRGGKWERVTLESRAIGEVDSSIDLLDLNDALERLSKLDENLTRLIELRFFGGRTVDEAAEVMGVSPRKAAKDWSAARLWLRRELGSRTE